MDPREIGDPENEVHNLFGLIKIDTSFCFITKINFW
jgi:hypothetical protein